jgi:hypothetical protein
MNAVAQRRRNGMHTVVTSSERFVFLQLAACCSKLCFTACRGACALNRRGAIKALIGDCWAVKHSGKTVLHMLRCC